jgi:hypothetical protein
MASLLELKKDFTALLTRDHLSHGYMLFGEAPRNAFAFLESFARFLETKSWQRSEILTDSAAWDGAKGEIGIDAVRAMQTFLSLTPVRSPKRTVLVHRADRFTLQAEHAFLKIAEEPPPHALIALTVSDPEALLPSLASRFQKYYVSGRDAVDEKKGKEMVGEFLTRDERDRKEWLKTLVENDVATEEFMYAMLTHLKKGFPKTAGVAGALLKRGEYMAHYNVNRRLQLEAALLGMTND